jgi:hypothetical protein
MCALSSGIGRVSGAGLVTAGSTAVGNMKNSSDGSVDAAQLIFVQSQVVGESCRMIA